jgi:hypothetical protein
MMRGVVELVGGAYTTFYWCIYPPSTQEEVMPNLQDCQDDLQDRLQKMRSRSRELRDELKTLKTNRDKTKIRRKFLEFKSVEKDIGVTENTLFTIDRQIELFERSKLDGLIIDTLKKSSTALQELKGSIPELAHVENVTEMLANRMSDVDDITQTLSTALSRGLEDDFSTLEDELNEFLKEDDPEEEKKTSERPALLTKETKEPTPKTQYEPQPIRLFGVEPIRLQQRPVRPARFEHLDSDSETDEKSALLAG